MAISDKSKIPSCQNCRLFLWSSWCTGALVARLVVTRVMMEYDTVKNEVVEFEKPNRKSSKSPNSSNSLLDLQVGFDTLVPLIFFMANAR